MLRSPAIAFAAAMLAAARPAVAGGGRNHYGYFRCHRRVPAGVRDGGCAYAAGDSPNRLRADPDMAGKHRQAKIIASLKTPGKPIAEINADLIRDYESFGFAARYDDLAAFFRARRELVDVPLAARLMREFRDLDVACRRLVYSQDAPPDNKAAALEDLHGKFDQLARYRERTIMEYVARLEADVAGLRAGMKACGEALKASWPGGDGRAAAAGKAAAGGNARAAEFMERLALLKERMDGLESENRRLAEAIRGKDAEIAGMTETAGELREALSFRNKVTAILSIVSVALLAILVARTG